MDTHPDLTRAQHQERTDRDPAPSAAPDPADQDDLRAVRRAVRDLSDLVSEVAVYLMDRSIQAEGGDTAAGPENRERLRALQEAAAAIGERVAPRDG